MSGLPSYVNQHQLISLETVVSNISTVNDIERTLHSRRLVPRGTTQMQLYSGSRWRPLHGDEQLGDVGIGPLSHVHLRCRLLGGASAGKSVLNHLFLR